jgi:hypothetical protein
VWKAIWQPNSGAGHRTLEVAAGWFDFLLGNLPSRENNCPFLSQLDRAVDSSGGCGDNKDFNILLAGSIQKL